MPKTWKRWLRPAISLTVAAALQGLPAGLPRALPQELEGEKLSVLRDGTVDERLEALQWLAKNGRETNTEPIVKSLRDTDVGVRQLAENALWSIWTRSGDPMTDERLKMGTYLMFNGGLNKSVEIFSAIIAAHPDFAEGYNKRATAWYLLGAYERSLADIRLTLERNGFHFGALSGAGYCMLKLERLAEAVAYMERALEINPNLDGVRELIRDVRKALDRKAI